MSSALCATQGWALDNDGKQPPLTSPRSPVARPAQALDPVVELYKYRFLDILVSNPNNLYGNAQDALNTDPTQGPEIAKALISLFPRIAERNLLFLKFKAEFALKADPTQGPEIAQALISLFPLIAERNPFYLDLNADVALNADPKQGPRIAQALISLFPRIVERDSSNLQRNADVALKADHTQGPEIAQALISLFPRIIEIDSSSYLSFNADVALNADPKQGPRIAQALISLFPRIFERNPVSLQFNADRALRIIQSLPSIEQQKLARSQDVEQFLTWAATSSDQYVIALKNLLTSIRRDVLSRDQAVATEVFLRASPKSDGTPSALIKDGRPVLPQEIVHYIGSFIGGRESPKSHKNLQGIRDREARARGNAIALGQVHASRTLGSERMLPSQSEEKLQRYHVEESAFLAANPGGDFKAAFAAKYPHLAAWQEDMITQGRIR